MGIYVCQPYLEVHWRVLDKEEVWHWWPSPDSFRNSELGGDIFLLGDFPTGCGMCTKLVAIPTWGCIYSGTGWWEQHQAQCLLFCEEYSVEVHFGSPCNSLLLFRHLLSYQHPIILYGVLSCFSHGWLTQRGAGTSSGPATDSASFLTIHLVG